LPVLVYRASRRPRAAFDPLDSSASVARDGWRFNDKRSEILYTAEVQSLSILEVAARPGWNTVTELIIAAIEAPDGTVFDLKDLGIVLPSNWNLRPAGPNAQRIGAEFLAAVDREAAAGRRVCGVRVPSVISTTDHNILLDPRQKRSFAVASWSRIPFDRLIGTAT
jgi:RES domain-containing protein